jgi:hypothetical protein
MKTFTSLLALIAGLFLSCATLSAVPVPVKLFPTGDGVTPANAGDATVKNWLAGEVNHYNTATPASLPTDAASLAFDFKVDAAHPAAGWPVITSGLLSISFTPAELNAYTYLVLHWGGPSNNWEAFYLPGGMVNNYAFTHPRNGLSSYSFYGEKKVSVPDSASSLALLALATLGLLGFARRLKR